MIRLPNKQGKLVSHNSTNELEKCLLNLYKEECNKIVDSVSKRCKKGDQTGISQMIGRRFGFFWEELVKTVLGYHFTEIDIQGLTLNIRTLVIESISDSIERLLVAKNTIASKLLEDIKSHMIDLLDESDIKIADCLYESSGIKRALEIKWRIRWNDAKTVKAHALGAHRLKSRGYEPIMLIRKERSESFEFNLERFEREGWRVLVGDDATNFVRDETHFDLARWIQNNVSFWEVLDDFHECLKTFNLKSKDFLF